MKRELKISKVIDPSDDRILKISSPLQSLHGPSFYHREYSLNFLANMFAVKRSTNATTELNSVEGLTAGDRSGTVVGGGYPPSPVPVIVEIDGRKYQAVVSGTKVLTPPNVQLEQREKVYWYKSID